MSFAYIVLFSWPLVVFVLYRCCSIPVATAWSVIGGYLFLPGRIGVDLPLLPNIDKDFIPAATALVIATYAARGAPEIATIPDGWIPRPKILRALLILLLLGALMTVTTNGERLDYQLHSIPGLRPYDAFSIVLTIGTAMLPLFLARKYLADPESHKALLLVLCLAGLIYSLPTLYEVRMSPQLNKIIYGYAGSDWRTNLRGGGYRPSVFLPHGLWLAIFFCCAILATIGLIRTASKERSWLFIGAAVWLFMTLVLAKSLGALLIAFMLVPVIVLCGVRAQLIAAAAIAAIILSYPALRGAGLVPVDKVVSLAAKIDPSRAASLEFRLRNEDILLAKANEKPLFGWGGWGRNRVYDERGKDISTTDGRWVSAIGFGGWTRYIAEFGFLTLPIIFLAFRRRDYGLTLATSALALVLGTNLIDLIPNATLTPVTLLIAGALIGRLEMVRIEAREEVSAGEVATASRYRRGPVSGSVAPDPATSRPASGPLYTRQTQIRHRPQRQRS